MMIWLVFRNSNSAPPDKSTPKLDNFNTITGPFDTKNGQFDIKNGQFATKMDNSTPIWTIRHQNGQFNTITGPFDTKNGHQKSIRHQS